MKEQKTKISRRVAFLLSMLIVAGLSFVSGNLAGKTGFDITESVGSPAGITNIKEGKPEDVDFSIFWEAWNKLNKNYFNSFDTQEMVYGAIKGLYSSVGDPYTEFFEPEENKRFKDDISGEFQGIGIEISSINGLATVVSPLPDSPAEKAGLKAKDIIMEVDGISTLDLSFDEIINKIRGEEGSSVSIKVSRDNEDGLKEFNIIRENIVVPSVTNEILEQSNKKISYIKVRQFGDDTESLFNQALNDSKNQKAEGIILDFRNNPGGYLDTSVDMASNFLDGGVVVTEVDKSGHKKDFKTSKSALFKDIKLVVLINEGSASASEIVAGALKDRNRAQLIGSKTFGKGSVQVLENLSDDSAAKITIAKWLTPKGEHIDKKGIEPDISIEDDSATEVDEILQAGLDEVTK